MICCRPGGGSKAPQKKQRRKKKKVYFSTTEWVKKCFRSVRRHQRGPAYQRNEGRSVVSVLLLLMATFLQINHQRKMML
ncbi:hypothetical protein PDJAM_G00207390 [Pangasius djambal]|uniref:Uncharacterized protein n=1 Tax=Pangasius djambal TaxID=1691987 RepID=A0ACC5Y9K2_9TELE|nr:hypothetical protein [Pangasius djambal]